MPLPFREVPEGASPFAFPVAVQDKAVALKALRAAGICALDLWSHPHPAAPEDPVGSPAFSLRSTVVGLPTHQGLNEAEVRRIAVVARDFEPAGQRWRPFRLPLLQGHPVGRDVVRHCDHPEGVA